MSVPARREGLSVARFIMVLSSLSPLFILWAVRGTDLIPSGYFIGACVALIVVPNCFLLLRVWTAKHDKDKSPITIGKAEDHRDHLLVYLFAMLLPFYTTNLSSWRDFSATLLAVCFIAFLFWHCNLHYMNVLFAVFGYRIFTIYPPDDGNPLSGRESIVLITRRTALFPGERILPYRLSNSVYWEVD